MSQLVVRYTFRRYTFRQITRFSQAASLLASRLTSRRRQSPLLSPMRFGRRPNLRGGMGVEQRAPAGSFPHKTMGALGGRHPPNVASEGSSANSAAGPSLPAHEIRRAGPLRKPPSGPLPNLSSSVARPGTPGAESQRVRGRRSVRVTTGGAAHQTAPHDRDDGLTGHNQPWARSVREGVVDHPGARHTLERVLAELAKGDARTGDEVLHRA